MMIGDRDNISLTDFIATAAMVKAQKKAVKYRNENDTSELSESEADKIAERLWRESVLEVRDALHAIYSGGE